MMVDVGVLCDLLTPQVTQRYVFHDSTKCVSESDQDYQSNDVRSESLVPKTKPNDCKVLALVHCH